MNPLPTNWLKTNPTRIITNLQPTSWRKNAKTNPNSWWNTLTAQISDSSCSWRKPIHQTPLCCPPHGCAFTNKKRQTKTPTHCRKSCHLSQRILKKWDLLRFAKMKHWKNISGLRWVNLCNPLTFPMCFPFLGKNKSSFSYEKKTTNNFDNQDFSPKKTGKSRIPPKISESFFSGSCVCSPIHDMITNPPCCRGFCW